LSELKKLVGKQVYVKISGDLFIGILIDIESDILVLFNGRQYLYIPMLHVHRITLNNDVDNYVENPSGNSILQDSKSISYREILTNAKGVFSEIHVNGNLSYHGYITNVLSDYFAFYSPVYKMMFISLKHLKVLIPYNQGTTPYTLSNEYLPVNPSNVPLVRSFENQLKKVEGRLIVVDGGGHSMKIGLLKKMENNVIELVNASGESVYLLLNHIKSVHLP
jgi:hypothetical protein